MGSHYSSMGRRLLIPGICLLVGVPVLAVTDAEVNKLQQHCEAAREKALAPIRAQRTQACIDQQLRSKGHCERYYTTYGNVTPGPSGAPQQGYFYNLPECEAWSKAREERRGSRNRS
jgi:hypothetical protein